MRTLRLLLQSLFVVANIAAVALLIASAYSDRVSPEKGLLFSYLGLAFPLICAGNLCFVVYWVFWRKWKFLLIGLGAFLVCLGPIRHYFPLHASKKVDREKVLKVLTYNVMAFGYRNHTKDSPNPIIQYIAESGADIVCLQEYAVARSGKHLTASKVFKALDMYPYRSVFYLNARGARRLGIAVLSKYPISRSRRVDYESTSNGSTVHELDGTGGGELCKSKKLSKLRLPQNLELAGRRKLRYSDTDLNGHVNNTRYADFACDALEMEKLGPGRFLSEMQIGYLAECRPGEELRLLTGRDGDVRFVQGMDESGKSRFEASLIFGEVLP